jgi:hypothetical protein
MDATLTDEPGATALEDRSVSPGVAPVEAAPALDPASADLLADLDHPRLVLSDGYVGPDRRGPGPVARLRRATFEQRRSLLRLELLIVATVVAVVIAALVWVGSDKHANVAATTVGDRGAPSVAAAGTALHPAATTSVAPVTATAPTTSVPTPTTTAPTPTTTAPPVPVATPAAVAPPTTAAPTTPAADVTPAQLGAEALTLVRYPWQRIPGYTIQFLPIADAPSPGFYGNTTFTWGHTGGTSVLYVYAGETVQRLAAITAFEIGHEVDAAAVEPQGGEAQIEGILGIHPASWAPNCDCAEQGFLSGWYAAAFSNYWSPGVGSFSTLAAEPSGSVLSAIEPWLNPAIS